MDEKDNYQFSISVVEGIIEIIITGEITENAIDNLHTEVISTIKGIEAKALLVDLRTLKGRFEDFAEAYFRVRSIPSEVRKLPSAIVDPSDNAAFQSFYETTAKNAGHLMKWFGDIESARTWLKSKV